MPARPDSLRLFVGIPFPDALKTGLTALRRPLPGLKWYTDQTLHLTLRFLGQTGAERMESIRRALARITLPAFSLHLDGLGLFAHSRQTVLWAGIGKSAELIRLKREVDQALASAGFAPDSAFYRPHLTLARLRARPGPELQALVAENRNFLLEWPDVREFTLYQSELRPDGARHSPLGRYPLGREE